MGWPFTRKDKDKDDEATKKSVLADTLPEAATEAIMQARQVVASTQKSMESTLDRTVASATPALSAIMADKIPASVQPYVITSAVFGAGALAIMIYRRQLRRIPTSAYLTPDMLQGRRVLRGKVTSVGDADNFRFYHTPGGFLSGWGWLRHVPKSNQELKGQTMHVRLAGVDAPEGAHFGMPAQPFSKEALEWLRSQLLGKTVFVKPYAKDRYDRVVSVAWVRRTIPFLPKKNVSLEMLKIGYGQVYKQAGAEYGGFLAEFERTEAAAKARKKGIWSQKVVVSAAEHKKQYLRGGDNS
ncbi:putative endonuclease lcl3 [Actinomortierella ambigua]|uniref:Probable endonuclease LCL3 n=1 Tax=Actinomortierella ambigua TaxID=1343610 RepID=A0A9P6U0P9_9FUNG|nr:putative endonuclease lcl3 [Actinomortierella ambigua]